MSFNASYFTLVPQWSLREHKSILLFTREFNTQCPSDIRNMFAPINTGIDSKVRDDHENLPECLNDTMCPDHITIDNEELEGVDGIFGSNISAMTIRRECSSWVVTKPEYKIVYAAKFGFWNISSDYNFRVLLNIFIFTKISIFGKKKS